MATPDDVDGYLNTVKRMEPDLHMVDMAGAAASISISLKRIADALDKLVAANPRLDPDPYYRGDKA